MRSEVAHTARVVVHYVGKGLFTVFEEASEDIAAWAGQSEADAIRAQGLLIYLALILANLRALFI